MKINFTILYLLGAIIIATTSCLDFVEDGIEVSYAESDATLTALPLANSNGAENEVIGFEIAANSNFDIKSLIVRTTIEGKNGSGFNVSDPDFDDPFADHNYGTIQPGTQNFKVRYDYIIPESINKSRITFILVDESGKKEVQQTVEVVPSITYHEGIVSYAKDNTFNDAIASAEGSTYFNIKGNYSSLTSENVEVQKKIDIIFYYDKDNKNAVIAAPASSRVDLELSVENNTQFKFLSLPEDTDLSEMSASTLDQLTEEANLSAEGASTLNNLKVGQYIGFIADLNAVNSLKKGILRVEGLHPGSVPRYAGISYVLRCSMIVQK